MQLQVRLHFWRNNDEQNQIQLMTIKNRYLSLFVSHSVEVFIYSALAGTTLAKLVHACCYNIVGGYLQYILSDVTFFVALGVILSVVCYQWRRLWLIRTCTIIAAVVCLWSFLNVGWLLRTGTQISPGVLLPVIWSPRDILSMIGVNLRAMPMPAVVILVPAFLLIFYFCYVIARPQLPEYKRSSFIIRTIILVGISLLAVVIRPAVASRSSMQPESIGLRYNAHIRAVKSFLSRGKDELASYGRIIPAYDEVAVKLSETPKVRRNIIIVVLEGVQYRFTSISGDPNNLTPFLSELAGQGVEFTGARSILTHTTKALFALLTGRYPSASQDIAETIPVVKPYAGITKILSSTLGYRTAFFQSAKGSFEGRPGLVYNMGFDYFWSREQLGDDSSFTGYLGCDEFAMLEPLAEWMTQSDKPFFLTIMCSVTHDPYEVPLWYAEPSKDKVARYQQTIAYTDSFLTALDSELARLGLTDNTIFCVIGDHGEAFGEHGMLAHEGIAYDEVLRVPFCIRAPSLIKPATKISNSVGSVDLAPTLLSLLGFDTQGAGFDGINVLGDIPADRKVYFTTWMQEGPAGYIQDGRKFVYDKLQKSTFSYDLVKDPAELNRIELPQEQADEVAEQIISWRKNTLFSISQKRNGSMTLYNDWFCRWADRMTTAKFQPQQKSTSLTR